MRTIIFSDTHLTDKFDQKTHDYLAKLINSADRVIINGDFFDGYYISLEKFLNSRWQGLFPLLKKKHTVFIYGNHDSLKYTNKSTSRYSISAVDEYELKVGGKMLKITHGNKYKPSIVEQYPFILNPLTKLINKIKIEIQLYIAGKNFPEVFKNQSKKIKRWALVNMPENEILVIGHTHYPEFMPNQKFINTGFIKYGFSSYLLVENDNFKLIKERY